MGTQSIHPIKIFYCYVRKDDALREQLEKQLSPLRRVREITGWFARDILAGEEWERESKEQLDTADIILLLISADFMASDYHYTVEMARALERHREKAAHVIPIILRAVAWEETPLGELSPLPTDGKPVTAWRNRDAAWLNVVQGISDIVRKLLPKRLLSPQDTDILYTEQGPLSGQIIGEKYLLGELIGEGGFSQVYKAQHLLIRRQQAVKVLLERHFRKREFRDRFLREAQTVASLDHPNIIHLDEFWVETSQAYLVMPLISGGTLQGILQKQQGFLEQDRIVSYLEDICTALDYAHQRGIVHLDLKPMNLLVHERGRLLLSDFGLAHLMKQGVIEGGSSLRVGTPHYMAPEHIKGSPEKRSDLFSLGIILYQMLVGRLPFDGLPPETILMKNMTEAPPAPRIFRPELPQAVQDMLGRALAKQPDQRFQTASDLSAAFKKAVATSPLPPAASSRPDQQEAKMKSPQLQQGNILYQANWSNGLNGWSGSSQWKISAGLLISNSGLGSFSDILITAPYQTGGVADYIVEVRMKALSTGRDFGIILRGDGYNHGYKGGITSDTKKIYLAISDGVLLKEVYYGDPLNWHTYRLEVKDNVIKFFMDDCLVFSVADSQIPSGGQVGIWAYASPIEVSSFKVLMLGNTISVPCQGVRNVT